MYSTAIKKKINELCKEQNVTPEDLHNILGFTMELSEQIVNGEYCPNPMEVFLMAAYLHVNIDEIVTIKQ